MTNKKRLIYANALMDCFKKEYELSTYPYFHINEIEDEIIKAPAVDDVEVMHGYWIGRPLDNFRKYEVKCSECGFVGIGNYDQYLEPYDFNYCPNCGARMDGDASD